MRTYLGANNNIVSSGQRLKLIAAIIGTVLLATAGSANAATVSVTISYAISYSPINGNGPSISKDIGTYSSQTHEYSFTEILTVGAPETTPVDFLTLSPNSSCGTGCVNSTASGTVNAQFWVSGVVGSETETGLYQADYSYTAPYLTCSGKTGHGQSDCINWKTNTNGGMDPLVFTLANGDVLDIFLIDAQDWSIKPEIAFELTAPSQTPLPGALPLFAGGLGVVGLLLRRKNRTGKDCKTRT